MEEYSRLDKLVSGGKRLFVTALAGLTLASFNVAAAPSTSYNMNPDPQSMGQISVLDDNIRTIIVTPERGDDPRDPDLSFAGFYSDGEEVSSVIVSELWDGSKEHRKTLEFAGEMVEEALASNMTGNPKELYIRGEMQRKTATSRNGDFIEYTRMDPYYMGIIDPETGEVKPTFVDGKDSKLYKEKDGKRVEYMLWEPTGYRIVWSQNWNHYPGWSNWSPTWDSDGDGVPNYRDPHPYRYDFYVDVNHNGIDDRWDINFDGAYGYYWINFYDTNQWWHMHDHVYVSGGWGYYHSRPYIYNDWQKNKKSYYYFDKDKRDLLDYEKNKNKRDWNKRPSNVTNPYKDSKPQDRIILRDRSPNLEKRTIDIPMTRERTRTTPKPEYTPGNERKPYTAPKDDGRTRTKTYESTTPTVRDRPDIKVYTPKKQPTETRTRAPTIKTKTTTKSKSSGSSGTVKTDNGSSNSSGNNTSTRTRTNTSTNKSSSSSKSSDSDSSRKR